MSRPEATLDARLLVGLRGPDLVASTARLALVDKMGFGGRLLGLRRYDFFHFEIDGEASGDALATALTAVLARQSTFYNRNKHMVSLEYRWKDGSRTEGPPHEVIKRGFAEGLGGPAGAATPAAAGSGIDFDGKRVSKADIVDRSPVFLVEAFVQDDDSAGRDGIASKLSRELTETVGRTIRVRCPRRATVWWLGIAARDEAVAMDTARQIVVTTRRGEGLLMNPNYQRAEFVSTGRIDTVRS